MQQLGHVGGICFYDLPFFFKTPLLMQTSAYTKYVNYARNMATLRQCLTKMLGIFMVVGAMFLSQGSALAFVVMAALAIAFTAYVHHLTGEGITYLQQRYVQRQLENVPVAQHPDDALQSWVRQNSFLLLIAPNADPRAIDGLGTAFAWDAHTLVTCSHCLPADHVVYIVSHADGKLLTPRQVYIVPGLDLAFIRLEEPHDYPLLLKQNDALRTNDIVWTLDMRLEGSTFPAGQRPRKHYPVRLGYYHGVATFNLKDVGTVRADSALMHIQSGMSGSPIMQNERLVGMAFAGSWHTSSFIPLPFIIREAAKLPPP